MVMSIQRLGQNSLNFSTRVLKNKMVLKTLENISKHPTSFSAGVSLCMSLGVRPLAIFATPDTEKENKQYAASNSICSGLIKFGMVEAVALPVEYAIQNIDNNPEKFLKPSTIKKLGSTSSKSYKLITQMLKLSTGFFTAIPKSILTIALIPVIMDKLFPSHKKVKEEQISSLQVTEPQKGLNFTGGVSEKISKGLGKIIDNERLQNFALKFQNKDKDIAKHMTAATDILLTGASVSRVNHSKDIKENRKRALNYNNIISTAVTLVGGYGLDRLARNKTGKFIENFKNIHAGDPKLAKYVEGMNILRPALIFAAIYYGILPIFSTYMAEKIDKRVNDVTNGKHHLHDCLYCLGKWC